jgi:hypothetical protein
MLFILLVAVLLLLSADAGAGVYTMSCRGRVVDSIVE